MSTDSWLPQGYSPKPGLVLKRRVAAGEQWQVYQAEPAQRVLLVLPELHQRWVAEGLLAADQVQALQFGKRTLGMIEGGRDYRLEAVDRAEPPREFSECQALVQAIVASRRAGTQAALDDAVYVERLSRLLPDYSVAPVVDDSLVAGFWITGGVHLHLAPTRRMLALVPWLTAGQLTALAQALHEGGARVPVVQGGEAAGEPVKAAEGERPPGTLPDEPFALPGRPHLEAFFNEHVIDLVRHRERYQALGIHFPGAILLHGPPGCGKTFAVDALIDYLDWPSFPVDSGSIGSPYIHETGRKIAEVFDKAAGSAPAVVVIDEIDAFLAARDKDASGQHRVEEVAEFLRGIPKASENRVLVIGMTNRLDSLDPAVVRRGRFDHILDVGMPSVVEVTALLEARLKVIPSEGDIDVPGLAQALAGRPLSDLGFILKEACRLAARAGLNRVGQAQVASALASAPSRTPEPPKARRIGFL